MTDTAKLGISLPKRTLAALEKARRRTGRTRSAVIAEAVTEWLGRRAADEADRRYAEAYLKVPERLEEVSAVAAAVTANWEPWE